MLRIVKIALFSIAVIGLFLAPPPLLSQHQPIELPLRVASQAPLQSLRLGLVPLVPDELEQGEVRIEVSGTLTNIWIDDRPSLLLDYEVLDSRLRVGWALSASTQIELGLEQRSGFGGLLDSLIQSFHEKAGFSLDGRDLVPRGAVNIEVRDPESGEILIWRDHIGSFSRGLSLALARTNRSPRSSFSYAASVRLPLPHEGEQWISGSTDAGLSAAWSRTIGGRSVHLGGGITRFGTNELDGIRIKRFQKTGFAAVTHPFSPRTAVILQYLFNEGVAEAGALSGSIHELTLGARVRISNRTAVEIGLLENLINYDNGPDFGIHLGIVTIAR